MKRIIVPAILALSASIVGGAAVSLAATSAPAVVASAPAHSVHPDVVYDW